MNKNLKVNVQLKKYLALVHFKLEYSKSSIEGPFSFSFITIKFLGCSKMWKDKYALAKNKTIPRPVSAFIVLLLLLLTILVPKTSAFSSESFEAHETITNAALKKFGFSSSAIGEVVDANLAQDNILDALEYAP